MTGSRRGILTGELLVVRGVFRSGSRMDREVAYLPLSEAQGILETKGVTSAALLLKDMDEAPEAARWLQDRLGPGFSVQDLTSAMPVVKYLLDVAKEEKFVLVVLIYAIAALGVLNTAMMAVMERARELGLLYALGMGRLQVALSLVWEVGFTYLYGAVPGAALGSLLVWILTETGIPLPHLADLSKEYNLYVGNALYPVLKPSAVGFVLGLSLVITLLAAVPPLVRALRVEPARAMRL